MRLDLQASSTQPTAPDDYYASSKPKTLGAAGWAAGTVFLDALDIFGFENFRTNSFEQLCINFANEKLHQLFLFSMFKAEEEVVQIEKVKLPQIDYCDNCLLYTSPSPRDS